MLTSEFDYELPAAAIAQRAIEPRDASRLLRVADMSDHAFRELPDLLHPGDLLVVNSTRVRHARLRGVREGTNGAVELLLLRPRRDVWEALVRPARRMRPGVRLDFGEMVATILTQPDAGQVDVALEVADNVEAALQRIGEVPLPPYFKGSLPDSERYQSIFAKVAGSAAAPTAALHFTAKLLSRLAERGVAIAEIELEVGLDTFRPIAEKHVTDHLIHTERFSIPATTVTAIEKVGKAGGRIVAVGTTVMRTLEGAATQGPIKAGGGATSLFITPGFGPKLVDALLTNFHAPRTTLVVLVASLLGERWRNVYQLALERGYRFLSFGDAMLIEDLRTR